MVRLVVPSGKGNDTLWVETSKRGFCTTSILTTDWAAHPQAAAAVNKAAVIYFFIVGGDFNGDGPKASVIFAKVGKNFGFAVRQGREELKNYLRYSAGAVCAEVFLDHDASCRSFCKLTASEVEVFAVDNCCGADYRGYT